MSAEDDGVKVELPPIWQFIHPMYNQEDSGADEAEEGEEEEEEEASNKVAPAAGKDAYGGTVDYVKRSRRAPRLSRLIRFLNEIEDNEELQQMLLEKDPVTQQTLLQWATLQRHSLLVEYLIKRLYRGAFSFDPESADVVVFDRWAEMRPQLPTAAEVAERQRQREQERAQRMAERAQRGGRGSDGDEDDDYDDEDGEEEEEEEEPTPAELVHESLEEYHDEWGDQGVGIVQRIGELGVYIGARRRDGTKEGLGQTLFPAGDCYAGEYKDNKRHGNGVYWWSTSTVLYCGEWCDNVRHGYGRVVYPDGSRYLGHWYHDKKHGQGRYTYADGSSYDGSWANNRKHGQGVYHLSDGSVYAGTFHEDDFVSGEWRLACGTVRYIGNFVQDQPDGAGVFVHRCGAKEGTFYEEGNYREGKWMPGLLKGSTRVTPRLELMAPRQTKQKRVPIVFAEECTGCGMADLVRAANYPPLLRWMASLTPLSEDPVHGVEVKSLEVVSIAYGNDSEDTYSTPSATESAQRVAELRVRPLLVDGEGKRVRRGGDPTLLMKEPTTRVLVLLEPATTGAEPMAVMTRSVQSTSPDSGHQQYRLPSIDVSADGTVRGAFATEVGTALRLSLETDQHLVPLLPAQRSHPFHTNAAERVLLYAQQIHPDVFVTIHDKLNAVAPHPSLVQYTAVPLSQVPALSTDGLTVVSAIAAAQQRADQREATLCTASPQRPPTPVPPPPEPRPELQPLYIAKEARDRAEAGEDGDEE